MKKNKLLKTGLGGIGVSLLLLSLNNSKESKILIIIAIAVFTYILLKGYNIKKNKSNH